MSKARIEANQTIQPWGRGLGIRIPDQLAKAAHITRGTRVRIDLVSNSLLVRVVGQPKLTLNQKLKAFDPTIHSGEAMACHHVGAEAFGSTQTSQATP